jgi:hypothetical protein
MRRYWRAGRSDDQNSLWNLAPLHWCARLLLYQCEETHLNIEGQMARGEGHQQSRW